MPDISNYPGAMDDADRKIDRTKVETVLTVQSSEMLEL